MPSVFEEGASQLKAGLAEGVTTLSENQEITFTKYVRVVLPLDGFIFWVKANLLSADALKNTSAYNAAYYYDESETMVTPSVTVKVQGSLHYATNQNQDAEQTMAINHVVFTALSEIQEFNQISPMVMFIGEFDGLKFAFNQRASFYEQTGLHHYRGDAVYSIMESQLIDSPEDFDDTNVVVSNSLPIWLTLNHIMPMYPSYLVPENLPPPFASIDIPAQSTEAIQSAPRTSRHSNHFQLVKERVKVTMYGLRNFDALDFQDYVNEFTLAHEDVMGVTNMPVIRDEKRTQSELNIIAMKKSIEFEVNYYQTRVRDIARQLILSCIPTYNLED